MHTSHRAPYPGGAIADALRRQQPLLILGILLAAWALQSQAIRWTDTPAMRTWATVFVAIIVQALPFLVGGVLLAASISSLLSDRVLRRVVPRNPVLAVPVAGLAGVALPGCECASVPVGGGMMRRGVTPAAALTFVLAAPAVNPVVLVTTAVAFPGEPAMVLARFLASLAVAVGVGWIWVAVGGRLPMREQRAPHQAHGLRGFLLTAQHDLVHTGGFLVLGAMVAASVNIFLPTAWLDAVADRLWLSVLALAIFAFVIAMCSEADAFVAASMAGFSSIAQLVFMVVGPAADVKLSLLHAGQFGRAFALRFVPLTFAVAVGSAVLVGWWLL